MRPRYARQDCYAALKTKGLKLGGLCHKKGHKYPCGSMNVVFLRSPRTHVRSQFAECYFSEWGRNVAGPARSVEAGTPR